MCDYSAEHAITREAAVGDKLVTSHISRHATVGFVEQGGDQGVAVCLLPGTTLILAGISEQDQQAWGVGEVATATFDQLTVDGAELGTYCRDGVIFNGKTEHVSLQSFEPGVEATVESLPGQVLFGQAETPAERELATV